LARVSIRESCLSGKMSLFQATDTGDSMVVHAFGAYFGLAVAGVLYSSQVEEAAEEREGSVYHSDLFSMIGSDWLLNFMNIRIAMHGDDLHINYRIKMRWQNN